MPDIRYLVGFDAAPTEVFTGLTTVEGVRRSDADLGTAVGDAGKFRFYGGEKMVPSQTDIKDMITLKAGCSGSEDFELLDE
jgi:hypothetical protein